MSGKSRRIIEGVPAADSASDRERGFLKALKNNLEFYGEEIDWDWLLTVSGEAFRVVFSESWHIATSYCSPIDIFANACAAYGYECEWFLGQEKEAAWRKIKDCIDSGIPVMSVGLADDEVKGWSIVAGYEGDMESALLAGHGVDGVLWRKVRGKEGLSYWVGDVPGKFTKEYPHISYDCPVFIVKGKATKPSAEELIEMVARLAVESAKHPSIALQYWGHVEFFFGTEALRLWAKALGNLDYDAEKQELESIPHYGWGNIEEVTHVNLRLIGEGRRAAANFFWAMGESAPEKKLFLDAAAEHYYTEAQIATEMWRNFFTWSDGINPFELEDREVAFQFASRQLRAPEMLEIGAKQLMSMREEELAAVENLQQLLPAKEDDLNRIQPL